LNLEPHKQDITILAYSGERSLRLVWRPSWSLRSDQLGRQTRRRKWSIFQM